MSVVVTGAGGFVGRQLVASLVRQPGQKVLAIDIDLSGLQPHGQVVASQGNIADRNFWRDVPADGIGGVLHLASMLGGAAENDPALAMAVNVDATVELMRWAAGAGPRTRFVFASSIAVLGDVPSSGVTDATPVAPTMIYGAHKAMVEVMIAALARRSKLDGLALRLPGILARPAGASTAKSAFLSDVFHAFHAGRSFVMPVSPGARIWAMSAARCADNFRHALSVDAAKLPEERAVTLPAVHARVADLVSCIAEATGRATDLVRYAPDPDLERLFASCPNLATACADRLGFQGDGSLEALVDRALSNIRQA